MRSPHKVCSIGISDAWILGGYWLAWLVSWTWPGPGRWMLPVYARHGWLKGLSYPVLVMAAGVSVLLALAPITPL